jgi:hypothetical protein
MWFVDRRLDRNAEDFALSEVRDPIREFTPEPAPRLCRDPIQIHTCRLAQAVRPHPGSISMSRSLSIVDGSTDSAVRADARPTTPRFLSV